MYRLLCAILLATTDVDQQWWDHRREESQRQKTEVERQIEEERIQQERREAQRREQQRIQDEIWRRRQEKG